MSTSWQPIETAPKEGSVIVFGRWEEGHEFDGQPWWNIAGCTETGIYGDWYDEAIPTHWMPLPEPPQTRGER